MEKTLSYVYNNLKININELLVLFKKVVELYNPRD